MPSASRSATDAATRVGHGAGGQSSAPPPAAAHCQSPACRTAGPAPPLPTGGLAGTLGPHSREYFRGAPPLRAGRPSIERTSHVTATEATRAPQSIHASMPWSVESSTTSAAGGDRGARDLLADLHHYRRGAERRTGSSDPAGPRRIRWKLTPGGLHAHPDDDRKFSRNCFTPTMIESPGRFEPVLTATARAAIVRQ